MCSTSEIFSGALVAVLNIILNGPDPGDLGGGEEAEATLDASWAAVMAPNAQVDFVVSAGTNTTDGIFLSESLHHRQQSGDGDDRELWRLRSGSSQTRRRRLFRRWRSRRRRRASPTSSPAATPGAEGCDNLNRERGHGTGLGQCAGFHSLHRRGWRHSVQRERSRQHLLEFGQRLRRSARRNRIFRKMSGTRAAPRRSAVPTRIFWRRRRRSQHIFQQAFMAIRCDRNSERWSARSARCLALGGRSRSLSFVLRGFLPDRLCGHGFWDFRLRAFVCRHHGAGQPEDRLAPGTGQLRPLSPGRGGELSPSATDRRPRLFPAVTCIFNDVTVGNNAVPGEAGYGTPSAKYQSTVGYDLATGLGSVNVAEPGEPVELSCVYRYNHHSWR